MTDEWNGQPIGECVLISSPDTFGKRRVHIERADPLVKVCLKFLEEAGTEGMLAAELGYEPSATFDGEVLTINGDNHRLSYHVVAGTLDVETRTVVMVQG